ncbi:MAG: hypothetical protein ACKOQM_00140 [Novosphingobium sp.]
MQINLSADAAMLSATRRAARRTPWMPLLSALLELAGGQAELVRHAERSWASVTFTGTRHTVVLSFTGTQSVEAGERFIDALPEHEFAIPRQLVADAAVIRVEHTALPQPRLEVEVQLLLLDEA